MTLRSECNRGEYGTHTYPGLYEDPRGCIWLMGDTGRGTCVYVPHDSFLPQSMISMECRLDSVDMTPFSGSVNLSFTV